VTTTDSPTNDSLTPTPRNYWAPTHYQPSPPPPYAPPSAPPKKRHRVRNTLLVVGAVFVGIGAINAAASGSKSTTNHQVVSGVQTPAPVPTPTRAPATTPAPAPAPTPAPASTTPPPPAETTSQSNAVAKADDDLQVESFSRTGLIKQLQFEGFSAADAAYAVDHVTVDWNQQAAKKATDYLQVEHFSHSGLVGQLVFDGFTPAQAEYGVGQAGL
jgi:hypothetical protein